MDLNLENYSLDDLLKLFKLSIHFNEADLKRAKHMVLKTHPDKSKLDAEVFLFFSQAYRIIYYVYQVRTQGKVEPLEVDDSKRKKEAAESFIKSPQFLKEFNDLFDKVYMKTSEEAEGYGDWLKSERDLDTPFESLKAAARAITVAPEATPQPTSLRLGSLGGGEGGSSYADLKHVYTTGAVIGVSESEDLPPARTAEQLKRERGRPINPMSREEAHQYFAEAAAKEGTDDAHRAFDLIRRNLAQEERTKNGFWGHLLRLN
jgi:hypothetical protein